MYCQCGCGEKTTYYPHGKRTIGIEPGGYARFVAGHHTRVHHNKGNAYLDEKDVLRIKKILDQKNRGRLALTNRQIGARFDVSGDTISAINTEKIWAEVPWPKNARRKVA